MTVSLDLVRQALDAAATPVPFFFRDDDVGWGDERLFPLLDLFGRHGVPVDLAVIPAALSPATAARLRERAARPPAQIGLHMHGFAHVNHEAAGRKCEFGAGRAPAAQRRDLEDGQRRLRELLGDVVAPFFTPPWNRCGEATGRLLVELGFRVLSRDAGEVPLAVPGLAELPARVDWQKPPEGRAARLTAAVRAGKPIGVMLHHAVLDDAGRAALDELLALLVAHGGARCRPMAALVDADVVEPARLVADLQAAGVPGSALQQLAVRYLRVGPENRLRALVEGRDAERRPVQLAVRRMDAGEGTRLAARVRAQYARVSRSPPPGGLLQAAIYARAVGLLVQVFPADAGLPGLPAAVDARAMAAVLEGALAPRTGGARVREVGIEVVRYKPERKCLLRYTLAWQGGAAGPAVVYGKMARRQRFERTRSTLARLRAGVVDPAFALPEPLGSIPDLCLELHAAVPGRALSVLVEAEDAAPVCRRVGAALRQLHDLPLVLEDVVAPGAAAAELEASAAELGRTVPERAAEVVRLGARLASALRGVDQPHSRVTHGDFHADNVLVDGPRLVFLDLEDAAMDDPAADVGSMWAQLTWLGIKAARRTAAARPASAPQAFLAAYLDGAPADVAARVPAHAAAYCLRSAAQCLRHGRDARRREEAAALLGAAARVLDEGMR